MKIGLPDLRRLWVRIGDPKSADFLILEVTKFHFPIPGHKFVYRAKRLHPPIKQQRDKSRYILGGLDLAPAIRDAYPSATNEEIATITKAVLEINATCCGIKEEGIACTAYERDLQLGPEIPDYDCSFAWVIHDLGKHMPPTFPDSFNRHFMVVAGDYALEVEDHKVITEIRLSRPELIVTYATDHEKAKELFKQFVVRQQIEVPVWCEQCEKVHMAVVMKLPPEWTSIKVAKKKDK
jgi:hypothetical protein